MIQRLMYRAQLKQGVEEQGLRCFIEEQRSSTCIANHRCTLIAGFAFERHLFLYIERLLDGTNIRCEEEIAPSLAIYLEDWPGEEQYRKWVPMIDVFHFNEPESIEHWKRKQKPERIGGRIAFLRPEMVASYIFYHYQLQEERGFIGPKYEIIGIHENMLFGYQEFPAIEEEPIVPGKLQSKQTPVPWSDTRMDLHFKHWDDGHMYFKRFDPLFYEYSGEYVDD